MYSHLSMEFVIHVSYEYFYLQVVALKPSVREFKDVGKTEVLEMTLCPKPMDSQFHRRKCIERVCEKCGVQALKSQLLVSNYDCKLQYCSAIRVHICLVFVKSLLVCVAFFTSNFLVLLIPLQRINTQSTILILLVLSLFHLLLLSAVYFYEVAMKSDQFIMFSYL